MKNKDKLKEGDIFKSYRQMCEMLEEKPKAGNSKKAQIKEWERFFSYHKDGNKFVIDEVYKSPLDKEENRGGDRNRVAHADKMERMLLYLIGQKESGELFLSVSDLLNKMNMINLNYSYGNINRSKVEKYFNMDANTVNEFFNTSKKTLRLNVESMLNRLENKSLIFYTKTKTVCIEDPFDDNNPVYSNAPVRKYVKRLYREATDEEIQLIMEEEKLVMNEMGVDKKSKILIMGDWKKFNDKVNKGLLKKYQIMFYYDSYKIIKNEKYIKKEIDAQLHNIINDIKGLNIEDEKDSLNNSVVSQLSKHVKNRADTSFQLFTENNLTNSSLRRLDDEDYLKNSYKLIDVFINHIHEDIRSNLMIRNNNNFDITDYN